MSDIEQMLVNEYRKIERAIQARKKTLAALKKQVDGEPSVLTKRPRVYQVEFDFVPGSLQPIQRTFTVEGGTVFHPATLASSLRVIGEQSATQIAQVTLGYGVSPAGPVVAPGFGEFRQEFFDFEWTIRDTGSDREWQNEKMPSVFLLSGHLSPLWLPILGSIRGGSEVAVEIDPVYNRDTESVLFETISSYKLTVQMNGIEEGAA